MFAAALALAVESAVVGRAHAYPLGLKPGLQLWSVKDSLSADQSGTLMKIGAMGYRELELYKLPASPLEFKQQCEAAGLTIIGGHFSLGSLNNRQTVDAALQLGMRYMIVASPTLRSLSGKDTSTLSSKALSTLSNAITADDYAWNAAQLNFHGAKIKQQGLQLGYHNHPIDARRFGTRSALDILIESTDPELVVFELDCGHMIHAGLDPIAYLRRHPQRIQLLHLKDLKAGYVVSSAAGAAEKDTNAELGKGVIAWETLFRVAARGHVQHYFVEHEGAMANAPMESIANSLRYLNTL